MCYQLEPHTERVLIETLLEETEEGLRLYRDGLDLAQENLVDLSDILPRLQTGATLGPQELLAVRMTLRLSRKTRTSLNAFVDAEIGKSGTHIVPFPQIQALAANLHSVDELVNAITAVIEDDGSIKDDASPQLRTLRKDVLRLSQDVKDELLKIINSPTLSKCLQEPIYTHRNGRYVLPVTAAMRRSIEGIVHDSSASGLTVYIEPLVAVELTNRIRIKESEIEWEIERLLMELSQKARARQQEIDTTHTTLVELDFIAARARLADKYDGVKPQLEQSAVLQLTKARHPLLVLQSQKPGLVVPNDINLGDDLRTLVITGPNTGGKTVFLKTAGLHALMVRAGLLLPVDPGSRIGIFSKVFADIGDEQSLEQNLSTFSSHMGTIIDITNGASESTLVLLDEIGAGTDPREGVVLARVILSQLKRSGALTLCSTHYGDLKTLAHSESGFANASMEFDDRSLRPTYRLQCGVPGNSHALEIARRLGLPEELVEEASAILLSEKPEYEIAIEALEQRKLEIAEREAALKDKEARIERTAQEMSTKQEQIEHHLALARERARNAFDEDYKSAKSQIKELTANLQKDPTLARAQKAREDLEKLRDELGWNMPEPDLSAPLFVEGQAVKIRSLNQRGTIDAVHDDHVEVRVGAMRVKVSVNDLETSGAIPVRTSSPAQRVRAVIAGRSVAAGSAPIFVRTERNTLDLRGKRLNEAGSVIEKFVDTAYLEHVSPVMIIHGHGTGALKSAVRDFLRDCSYNISYRPGETHEGGDGVTVISF